MVNWYVSFLSDRKQRLVYNGTVCDWMMISKGTMQGSVSRPHLFNLFFGRPGNRQQPRRCIDG